MRFDPDLFGGAPAFAARPLPQRELVIVGFAGGGGSCTGIAAALGRAPDIAINHDAWALAVHAANHPATLHLSKNIWQVDPHEAVKNRPVGLAWFSPDCKHFSKAKGGRPVKRSIRDLAWVVVLWAKRARPRVIMLENVEEFRDWGPVSADGQPDKARKGETFARWVAELQRLGYRVEWRELVACDYGAPTTRKRLYLIARRDGRPIVWPAPTHGRPSDPDVIAGRKRPWRTAAEIIDWSLPCPSIFATSEEIKRDLGIRANRPLAEATMARIAKGVWRYVLTAAAPFIVPVTHKGDTRVHSGDEPVRMVTSARRGELAVVAPFTACGQQGGSLREANEPHRTITASAKDTNAVVAPYLVPRYGERTGQEPRTHAPDEPLPTVVPTGNGASLVAAHLTKFRQNSVGAACDAPAPTITANSYVQRPGGAAPIGVVCAALGAAEANFSSRSEADEEGDDAARGEGFDDRVGEAGPERHGRSLLDDGYGGVSKIGAFLAQHNTDMVGHQAEAPLSKIVDRGYTQRLAAAHLQRRFGASVGAQCDVPAPTSSANSHEQRPGGVAQIGVSCATFGPTSAPAFRTDDGDADFRATGIGLKRARDVAAGDEVAAPGEQAEGEGDHAERPEGLTETVTVQGHGASPPSEDAASPEGQCRLGAHRSAVTAAFLAQHNTDMTGHKAEAPLSTIVGKGCTQGLVAAHLQRPFGASVGAPCDEPAPTITAGGAGKTAIAAAHIVNLHGVDRRDRAANEPCPTVSAGGNHVAEVRAFLMRYYGEGGQWSDPRAPSPTDTTKARMGLVTVAGLDWQIVDIGMRMLSPRERFDAQGFPPDYVIDAELGGRRITGEIQGRLVGNSVCPPVAEALVAANCADMAVTEGEVAA